MSHTQHAVKVPTYEKVSLRAGRKIGTPASGPGGRRADPDAARARAGPQAAALGPLQPHRPHLRADLGRHRQVILAAGDAARHRLKDFSVAIGETGRTLWIRMIGNDGWRMNVGHSNTS